MTTRIDQLPAVATCYAYRPEYVAEMEGMIETVRQHHPRWQLVVARGPVPGFEEPTLEVESPLGRQMWTLPVPLRLDGGANDFLRICDMKALRSHSRSIVPNTPSSLKPKGLNGGSRSRLSRDAQYVIR